MYTGTQTFIATRPHHDNVIYRIRSYPTPRLEVDSLPIGYKWPVWEAAKGTYAVQPSSTPIRIFRHSIPYRFGDPSSHGHSNPATSAIQEAKKLFPNEVVLLASIGTGAPIQDIEDGGSHNSIVRIRVNTYFDLISIPHRMRGAKLRLLWKLQKKLIK